MDGSVEFSQGPGHRLNRLQALTEAGHAFPVPFEFPVGQVAHAEITDAAEGRTTQLRHDVALPAPSGATRYRLAIAWSGAPRARSSIRTMPE